MFCREAEKNAHEEKLKAEDLQEQLDDVKKQLKDTNDIRAKLEADLKITRDQVDEQMARGRH